MNRSIFGAHLRARLRNAFASAAILVVACASVFACTDAGVLSAPGSSRMVQLGLAPRFHLTTSMQMAPINLARLTVLNAATRDVIGGPIDATVDPADAEFHLPVSFEVPDGTDNIEVVVSVELLNVTDGVETVQWSGVTSAIPVHAGATTPTPPPIDLFPGPVANFNVTSIVIAPKPAQLTEGDNVQLIAVAAGSPSARIFWATSDADVATVDSLGVVRPLRGGNVMIIASAGPHADTARIAVRSRIVSVRIAPDTAHSGSVGDDVLFTATAVDARGLPIDGEAFTWTSSDDAVVTSIGGGHFTTTGNGAATVRAVSSTNPSLTATARAVVSQHASTITLDLGTLELTAVGDRHAFVADVRDARGVVVATPGIHWTTGNAAVATVDANGVVTATGNGSTTVIATSPDGPVATATVNVHAVVTALSLSPATMRLTAFGDTARILIRATDHNGNPIAAPALAWISSDPSIATVDSAGLVRAVSRGSVTISASGGSAHAQITVEVQPVAARITVNPDSIVIPAIGVTATFTAHVFDHNDHEFAATPEWSSTSSDVATVNNEGVATSVANGTTSIVATVGGVSGSARLRVEQVVAHIEPIDAGVVLGAIGSTMNLHIRATDASNRTIETPHVTWSSDHPDIIRVDANGVVTALGFGDARITVSAGDVSAFIDVRAVAPTLRISPDSVAFTTTGQTQQLTARLRDVGGSEEPVTPQWSSSNNSVATVSSTGLVTAIGIGTAVIHADVGGITADVPVAVTQSAVPGSLSGRVINAANNGAIAGATVTFDGPSGHVVTTADGSGVFTSPPLIAGSYEVTASATGFNTTILHAQPVTSAVATPIGNLPLVPASTLPGSISGVIQDARNTQRVPNATVSLRSGLNASTGPIVGTTTSDAFGAYSFTNLPAGVYSVSVSAAGYADGIRPGIILGGSAVGGQDVTISPLGATGDWRIVLTWGATPSDLDSHLTGPLSNSATRFHVAYYATGSLTSDPFAQLDHDDTSAFGPETVTMINQIGGVYRYFVHNFSNQVPLTQSGAHVEVYHGGTRVAVFDAPTSGSGRYWSVFEINGDNVIPVNMIVSSEPGLRAAEPTETSAERASDLFMIDRDIASHSKNGVSSPSRGGPIPIGHD